MQSENKIREWSHWDTVANLTYILSGMSTIIALIYAFTGNLPNLVAAMFISLDLYLVSKIATYFNSGKATILWWEFSDNNTE